MDKDGWGRLKMVCDGHKWIETMVANGLTMIKSMNCNSIIFYEMVLMAEMDHQQGDGSVHLSGRLDKHTPYETSRKQKLPPFFTPTDSCATVTLILSFVMGSK